MSGAITGVTGWAPEDSPNFTTSAKRAGVEVADMNDLATLESSLIALMNAQIQSAFESLPSLTISNNIVVASGVLTSPEGALSAPVGPDAWGQGYGGSVTIPTPQYSDGVNASLAECKSILTWAVIDAPPGNLVTSSFITKITELTYSVGQFEALNTSARTLLYIVIAIRANT
jgi:hypothetical protein